MLLLAQDYIGIMPTNSEATGFHLDKIVSCWDIARGVGATALSFIFDRHHYEPHITNLPDGGVLIEVTPENVDTLFPVED